MKYIYLADKTKVLVDDEDFDYLKNYIWKNNYLGYAVNLKNVRMHRLILQAPKRMEVDHINGNTLDNRKSNLRLCTHQQNLFNQKKSIANKSGYKGVYWFKPAKLWRAFIKVNQKQIHLGYFKTAKKAFKIRKKAELSYFGEFRRNIA